jgi:CheY-like chemotaxis protein
MTNLTAWRGVDPTPVHPTSYTSNHLTAGGAESRHAETLPSFDDTDVNGTKPRALVVDDAPDVTEMIAMLLRYGGYDVVTVFNATDAFDAARGEQFDVVVSDIGMPGMNGYQLAEALRALPAYKAVPLIAVTGFAMYDDRERALDSGFDAFLTKPINPMDLIDLVKRLHV